MTKIVIIGGGIAGCTTALELAKNNPEAEIIILEQSRDILQSTSARTPGRMGLGYHYFDAQTSQTYMEHTIGFMKKYSDCFVGEESKPHLQSGRYFIVKDSILPPDEVLAGYEKISSHFQEICAKDASNNIFQTQRLHKMLNPADFEGGVDPKK
jgi:choline dehydrogenase-like flavoprotein